MIMRKLLCFIALSLAILVVPAFADSTDKATLGGQDSNGYYHWRVDSSGNFIPGADNANSIGDASHQVETLYAADITASDTLTFKTNLLASGVANGGATTVVTGTTALPATYSVASVYVTSRTLTVGNGTEGQILVLYATPLTDTGTLTITATTKTGWSSIAMDTVADSVTLLYVDDTVGWIVVGMAGVTVS